MNMIITSECEYCKYGIIDDSKKAKVMVHCELKDKSYIYGQCVPCDDFNKRKANE